MTTLRETNHFIATQHKPGKVRIVAKGNVILVFINADLSGGVSNRLLKVALEEVTHYVTGATDNSRDFQDYLLDLAVKLGRTRSGREIIV